MMHNAMVMPIVTPIYFGAHGGGDVPVWMICATIGLVILIACLLLAAIIYFIVDVEFGFGMKRFVTRIWKKIRRDKNES